MHRLLILIGFTASVASAQLGWVERNVETSPPGLIAQASAGDSGRGRIVTFGGSLGLFIVDQTWEWDGVRWEQRVVPGPAARYHAKMVYDEARQVCVLFGGAPQAGGYLGDTWEWDGAVWTQVATGGPAPRRRHAMAYDPTRQRTVLFGGEGGPWPGPPTTFADTWEWDGVTWTPATPPTSPAAVAGHGMALSPSGRLVMAGWSSPISLTAWEWDGANWWNVSPPVIPGRDSFGFAFDAASAQTVLFGGSYFGSARNDVWIFDGSSWSGFPPLAVPPARWSAVLENDPGGGLLLFGGTGNGVDRWRDNWAFTAIPQGPASGQANTADASLDVAGASWIGHSSAGPFIGTVTAGGPLTLAVQGPQNMPFMIAVGSANPNNSVYPGGSLDIGTPPGFADIVVLVDGTMQPFATTSVPFTAYTQALYPTVYTRHLTVMLPPFLSGATANVQGLTFGANFRLTAAYYLSIL